MLIDTGIDINHPGGQKNRILYDEVNKKYWDSSLSGGTYSDQVNYIAALNSTYHGTEWGPWRLATERDIESLHISNPLPVITSLFFRTEDRGTVRVWQGRYDKVTTPGNHGEFVIRWTYIDQTAPVQELKPMFDFSTEKTSVADTASHGGAGRLGAWIVADAAPRRPEPPVLRKP